MNDIFNVIPIKLLDDKAAILLYESSLALVHCYVYVYNQCVHVAG